MMLRFLMLILLSIQSPKWTHASSADFWAPLFQSTWAVHPPPDFSAIQDAKLRHHLESFFSKPIKVKLSNRRDRSGGRVMGMLPSGKRLRGFWSGTERNEFGVKGAMDYLSAKYDDFVANELSTIEFELQLPPVDKTSGRIPSALFKVAFERGGMDEEALVPRGCCFMRILPNGRSSGVSSSPLDVGRAFVSVPMKSGQVDPNWAKGKKLFRRGKSSGMM